MDFKHYRKIKDEDHIAVLRHADGHEIRIAKKALSHRLREKLSQIPLHMVKGGMVKGGKAPKPAIDQTMQNNAIPQESAITDQAPSPIQSQLPNTTDQNIQAPGAQAGPPPMSDDYDSMMNTFSGMGNTFSGKDTSPARFAADQASMPKTPEEALRMEQSKNKPAQAPEEPVKQAEDDYESALNPNQGLKQPQQQPNPQANIQQSYLKMLGRLGGEYDRLQQAAEDTRIDPDAFMNKLGLGDRLLMAVGMMISGGGAAMAGQKVAADEYIKGRIDRNIKAQEAEMGKRKNLLSEYTKMLGNLPAGKEMLAAIQLGAMSSRFKRDAAKLSHDPIKQQEALKHAQEYHQQAAQLIQGLALKNSMQLGGGAGGSDIMNKVPHQLWRDAYKEKKEAVNAALFSNEALKTFDEIADINNPSNRLLNPIQSKRQLDAKRELYKAKLAVELAHRYTEQDSKAIGTIFKQAFDNPKTTSENRKTLERILFSPETFAQRYPILHDHGVDIGVPIYKRPVKTAPARGSH